MLVEYPSRQKKVSLSWMKKKRRIQRSTVRRAEIYLFSALNAPVAEPGLMKNLLSRSNASNLCVWPVIRMSTSSWRCNILRLSISPDGQRRASCFALELDNEWKTAYPTEQSDGRDINQFGIDRQSRLFDRQSLGSRTSKRGYKRREETTTNIIEIAANDVNVGCQCFQVIHRFFGA